MLSMDGMPKGWHGLKKVDKDMVHRAIQKGWVASRDWLGAKGENRMGAGTGIGEEEDENGGRGGQFLGQAVARNAAANPSTSAGSTNMASTMDNENPSPLPRVKKITAADKHKEKRAFIEKNPFSDEAFDSFKQTLISVYGKNCKKTGTELAGNE